MKQLVLFLLFLTGIPAPMLASGDKAKTLTQREVAYYDSAYSRITYVLDNMSSSEALTMIDELRDYAEEHQSKYGFYIVTWLNAHIARDMGMIDRAEELMQASIDYQKHYLADIKPMTDVYKFMAGIYEDRLQGEKAIQILDEALEQEDWSIEDRIALLSLRCNAVTRIEPVDTARFMAYHDQLHAVIDQYGYRGNATAYTECYHAQFTRNYPRLLTLAEKITNKGDRLRFKIEAYDGLERNQEAIDSFMVYKAWTDQQFNAETRKLAEMSALELEASRAENEAETLRLSNQRMLLIAIVCGLILFCLFLAIYIRRRFLQMRKLRQAYDQLEQVTTQKERIESELRIARNIQLSMVPSDFPKFPGLDLYANITPAKAVGGDLYDFFVRDNQLFFCIGDVSGKGVPAALFMMMTKSLFRAYSSEEPMPDRIVTKMNQILGENNKNHMFVTLFVGVFDLSTGLLRYCNASHEKPIVIREEASPLPVLHTFPVGFFANTVYQMQEVVIEPHTTILFYTDGLNEAMNADENMFGRERISDEIRSAIQSGQLSPKALIDQLTDAVHQFVGNTEQSDDLTLLAISYSEPSTEIINNQK